MFDADELGEEFGFDDQEELDDNEAAADDDDDDDAGDDDDDDEEDDDAADDDDDDDEEEPAAKRKSSSKARKGPTGKGGKGTANKQDLRFIMSLMDVILRHMLTRALRGAKRPKVTIQYEEEKEEEPRKTVRNTW